jgi:hypothetical protein
VFFDLKMMGLFPRLAAAGDHGSAPGAARGA